MFMPIIISTAIVVGLIQLGAMSVWITVLSLVIKALLLAGLVISLLLFYRQRKQDK
jgi:hypothetical protein